MPLNDVRPITTLHESFKAKPLAGAICQKKTSQDYTKLNET